MDPDPSLRTRSIGRSLGDSRPERQPVQGELAFPEQTPPRLAAAFVNHGRVHQSQLDRHFSIWPGLSRLLSCVATLPNSPYRWAHSSLIFSLLGPPDFEVARMSLGSEAG